MNFTQWMKSENLTLQKLCQEIDCSITKAFHLKSEREHSHFDFLYKLEKYSGRRIIIKEGGIIHFSEEKLAKEDGNSKNNHKK